MSHHSPHIIQVISKRAQQRVGQQTAALCLGAAMTLAWGLLVALRAQQDIGVTVTTAVLLLVSSGNVVFAYYRQQQDRKSMSLVLGPSDVTSLADGTSIRKAKLLCLCFRGESVHLHPNGEPDLAEECPETARSYRILSSADWQRVKEFADRFVSHQHPAEHTARPNHAAS